MRECGVMHPDIVYAQSLLETGGFKSHIFRSNNNLFGMKVARSRPTTAKGENNGHAYYDHWTKSVIDYALYQSAFLRKFKKESDYMDYISANYAEDPVYISKVRKIVKKLRDED